MVGDEDPGEMECIDGVHGMALLRREYFIAPERCYKLCPQRCLLLSHVLMCPDVS